MKGLYFRLKQEALLGCLLFFLHLIASGQVENKVLIIGIDGCRPDALTAANTPIMDELIKHGAVSYEAKTDALSSSGIGWTGMLTGVWHQKHNVISNAYKNPNTTVYPHFFARVKQADPTLKTYSVVNWKPIHNILPEDQVNKKKHRIFDAWVSRTSSRILKNQDVDVMFVQFDKVDHAGHQTGFSKENKKYLIAIEKTDNQIGRLIKSIEKRKTHARENWLIIVSADHGGSGHEHGKDTLEHRRIFYIASGSSAREGVIDHEVDNIDVAPTALRHLGIELQSAWNLDGKVSGLKKD